MAIIILEELQFSTFTMKHLMQQTSDQYFPDDLYHAITLRVFMVS